MGSGITLIETDPADIPTPTTGKSTIFIDSTNSDEPSYKDDAGTVHTLVGTPGSPGPTGAIGAQGPPGFSEESIAGDNDIRIPPAANISPNLPVRTITINFNGQGSALTVGLKAYYQLPVNVTILSWTLFSNDGLSGDLVVDLWVDTYANFPPTVADTITAAAKPTLTAANKNTSAAVSTWSTTIPAGSFIAGNIDSATTITNATLEVLVRVN